jgi:phospholipid/cholesterol/gamma-HCH transport system ATP-binding protein
VNVWYLAISLRELTHKNEREITAIVEEKLRFVDLENAKDLMPSELSGGMKKRIAVARSLVMSPDLISNCAAWSAAKSRAMLSPGLVR